MTVIRDVVTFVERFNRAQAFTATPGQNGWAVDATAASGTPTHLCITEDGGAAKLTLDDTSEVQVVPLFHNDVLVYDLAKLQHVWVIAKVADVSAVTTLVMGVGSAQDNTADSVSVNAWFRMEGSASTSALVVETDDNTVDNDDVSTGQSLAGVYKKLHIDFTNGLSDVRFFVDGERVAESTKFDMSAVTSGQNVQPYIQLQKASGDTTPSVTIAEFGAQYTTAYGA